MNEPKAARYQRIARRARLVGGASGVLLLVLLAVTPVSRWLADVAVASGRSLPPPLSTLLAVVVFVGLVTLLWEIVALPVVLYLGLRIERRFGRPDQSVRGVLEAQGQATLVALAVALVASLIVSVAVQWAGGWWWLAAGGLLALTLVGALRLASALLPAFGEARPLSRRTLMSALREIARRSGVPVSDILEWRVDAGKATALVTGIGRTCRVFVASEVIRDWSDDEIVVVVAHELAHHVHHDLWRALALDAAVFSASLWAAQRGLAVSSPLQNPWGAESVAALPLVALIAGTVWLAATPIRLAQSRAHERRADRFALRMTGEAGAFGTAIRRLSARHLAEERPSRVVRWFFYRHPPVAERLELAERFAKAEGTRQKTQVGNELSRA